MARRTGDEDDEETASANRVHNWPPWVHPTASRSQSQPQMPIQRRSGWPQSTTDMETDPVSDSDSDFEGASDNTSRSIPVVLNDPDLLDCPICFQPLCSPIYQCEHGHIACSSCCIKANNKCSSCCSPIGFIRCRVMEKLTESLTIECKNKRFGCEETLINHKKSEHENTCPHTACFCPLPSCNFTSSSKNLYNHFRHQHASSATSFTYDNIFYLDVEKNQKHVILQEQNEGVIFILNHEVQGHGRVFSVDCIGFKNAFVYQLTVKCNGTCLSIETVCTNWKQHTPDISYLTIPSAFLDFHVQVCVKKAHPVCSIK